MASLVETATASAEETIEQCHIEGSHERPPNGMNKQALAVRGEYLYESFRPHLCAANDSLAQSHSHFGGRRKLRRLLTE